MSDSETLKRIERLQERLSQARLALSAVRTECYELQPGASHLTDAYVYARVALDGVAGATAALDSARLEIETKAKQPAGV